VRICLCASAVCVVLFCKQSCTSWHPHCDDSNCTDELSCIPVRIYLCASAVCVVPMCEQLCTSWHPQCDDSNCTDDLSCIPVRIHLCALAVCVVPMCEQLCTSWHPAHPRSSSGSVHGTWGVQAQPCHYGGCSQMFQRLMLECTVVCLNPVMSSWWVVKFVKCLIIYISWLCERTWHMLDLGTGLRYMPEINKGRMLLVQVFDICRKYTRAECCWYRSLIYE